MNIRDLLDFVDGYLECALWSSVDLGDGESPLDENYDVSDFSIEARTTLTQECTDFLLANLELLEGIDASQAGHDFWLTRNRHGAGFWDRGLGEVGTKLTEAAHVYGGVDLYVVDGKIHCN